MEACLLFYPQPSLPSTLTPSKLYHRQDAMVFLQECAGIFTLVK